MRPENLSIVRWEKWIRGLHPHLRWSVMEARRQDALIDFIYDYREAGVSVNGERKDTPRSYLKNFEGRIRKYGLVGPPSRLYFDTGEIVSYPLTEQGKEFALLLGTIAPPDPKMPFPYGNK